MKNAVSLYTSSSNPLLCGQVRNTWPFVRPRGSADWLLIYTLGGSGLHRHERGEYRTVAGDITLYAPDAYHDYKVDPITGEWIKLYAHFQARHEWIPWLNWPETFPGFMLLKLTDETLRKQLRQRFLDMIRLCSGPQLRCQVFAMNALEEILLWCDSVNPLQAAFQIDLRIRNAMDFLSTHLNEPFSEIRLSKAAKLSPSQLRRLFRQETGFSPRDFLELERLNRAKILLSMTRQTIAEISLEIGFENPFYFSLRFKKHTGQSPRAFRGASALRTSEPTAKRRL
jgi:AraC family transcriptional regulator of arabinose operon